MLKHTGLNSLLFLVLFSGSFISSAQNLTKSPYSAYGPGEPLFGGFAHQAGMAHLSMSVRNPVTINPVNPASYSALKMTTFEAGGIGSVGNLQTSGTKQKFNNASFGYLSLGFPISAKRHIGGAFGLVPYSTVGYNISNTTNVGTVEGISRYEGRGGLSKFFLGTGLRVLPKLHAGVNATYIFGQLNTSKSLVFKEDLYQFNFAEDRDRFVGGLTADLGLQFRDTLRNNMLMTFGGKVSLGGNIGAEQRIFARTFLTNTPANVVDTVIFTDEQKGKIRLPRSYSIGLGLERPDTFMIGVDATFTEWKSYRTFNFTDSLKNNFQISVGGYWIPDVNAEKGYFKKIQYMAGLRYQKGYLDLNNNSIDEYGASIGFGLPLNRKRSAMNNSRINIALEYFKRGTIKNNLIKEDHIRIAIGFTLSERWFIRRKFL